MVSQARMDLMAWMPMTLNHSSNSNSAFIVLRDQWVRQDLRVHQVPEDNGAQGDSQEGLVWTVCQGVLALWVPGVALAAWESLDPRGRLVCQQRFQLGNLEPLGHLDQADLRETKEGMAIPVQQGPLGKWENREHQVFQVHPGKAPAIWVQQVHQEYQVAIYITKLLNIIDPNC